MFSLRFVLIVCGIEYNVINFNEVRNNLVVSVGLEF